MLNMITYSQGYSVANYVVTLVMVVLHIEMDIKNGIIVAVASATPARFTFLPHSFQINVAMTC